MPAFTAVGAYVAGTLLGLAGTAAVVVGAIVATGAAYVTSRIINGNPNKGNNSAGNQGGRIQVPPATNNKIPVVYGSAYVNGIITDARLKSIGGTTNDTMYYCIVLSEYTNNLTTPQFNIESVLWNDLRLTAVDATTNAHKVKDGRKVVDGAIVTAGSFVVGKSYVITKRGTTNFVAIGAQTNNIGQIFTATGVGSGTGQAQEEDFIDTNFIVDNKSLVELRVYAGSSAAADQIYPPQSSGNTVNAYDFWGNDDGSWDSTYQMKGLVFAIVKLTYNGDKGFTALPNVTFQLANNVANPADVWYDYMTSQRYGAGIDPAYIDMTAKTDWYNFCEEDITYTNVAGETNQTTLRYNINGVIDTANQVKTNIDTILQNGGAWMSYNVATGLWSPIIKKAVTAGIATESATLFTASRSGTTLTVTAFPSGRIEPGQRLYNSAGTFIGTISAQIFPLTAGETTGQKGRYTTSSSGTISSTTFYTLQSAADTLSFNDNNIISGISISSTRLEDLYNQVEAEFYNRYNKDQRSYARVDLDPADRNPNEPDNQLRLSLDLVNNSMQADILGQLEMRQSRDDLVIEFTSNHYGIQAQAGDIIGVTSDLYGWAPKYFRVMRVKEIEDDSAGLSAQIQALEYNPDVYTIEPITEFSTSANIGIGNLVSSVNIPKPDHPIIDNPKPDDPVPYFTYEQPIPATGGPFDEIEIYYTEGWDPNSVTGTIVPGTGSNGVPVGKGLMTVTAVTYNSINVGDYFDLGGVTVENQLTQSTISTKTYASGGAVGAFTVTLNNVTGVVIGQKPTGTGIPTGAMVTNVSGNTVTLDRAFTIQATGNYLFTTAGGTGTYQVSISTTASGTDDLYDQPVASDFRYLKKITPQGNASSFASGTTVSIIISELPANTQTYRRWFLKSRLGWKKNFGEFSDNQTIDLDGNVSWQPNPTASGRLSDLLDVNVATRAEGDILYYDATTSKWRNTPVLSIKDDQIAIGISTTTNSTFTMDSGLTNAPSAPLILRHSSTGTPTTGFGTTLGFETETPGSGIKTAGYIDFQMVDATTGSEDFQFGIGLMKAGVEPSPSLLRPLTLTNNGDLTLTGTGQFLTFSTQPQGVNTMYGIRGMSALDDPWFVGSGSVGNDLGYLEIATGDNQNGSNSGGQIYVRQYNGQNNGGAPWYGGNGTVQNELILLDNTGQTFIPNNLTVDGGTLFVDSINNRVGINDTSPSYDLDVTGNASISNTLYIGNIATVGEAMTVNPASTYDLTLSTSLAANPVTLVRNTANTNISTRSLTLKVDSTGTPAVGFGNTLEFQIENASNVQKAVAYIDVNATNITAGSETFQMNFGLMNAGAAYTGVMNLSSTGNLQIDGDLQVDGNDIKKSGGTTVVTFSGTNLTTFAGDIVVTGNTIQSSTAAAIELNGANVEVLGDLTVTGNDIKSSGGTTAITLSGATVSMPSDLTVDSGTLKVDATNNRVGVNNASPAQALDVVGNIIATGDISSGASLYATNRIDGGGVFELYSTGFGPSVETQVFYYTATGNSLQTVNQWATISYRTGKYTLSMRKGTDYHCIELMILHDDTTAYMTQYNEMFTNASLATLSVDISAGNVRLRVTPATVGSLEMVIERKLFTAI